jgi:hypothetical protein
MFLCRWAPRAFSIRIDAIAGESLQTCLRRDGRVDLWAVHDFILIRKDNYKTDCHLLPSYITTPSISGKTFEIVKRNKNY